MFSGVEIHKAEKLSNERSRKTVFRGVSGHGVCFLLKLRVVINDGTSQPCLRLQTLVIPKHFLSLFLRLPKSLLYLNLIK